MKKPDEIKKGLECCVDGNIVCAGNCVFDDDAELCFPDCVKLLMANALALIQQLQAENAEQAERIQQLEAERDALINDIRMEGGLCALCKHSGVRACEEPCRGCNARLISNESKWEWRGVQKEE